MRITDTLTRQGAEVIVTDKDSPRFGQRGLIATDTYRVQFSDDGGETLTEVEFNQRQIREAE